MNFDVHRPRSDQQASSRTSDGPSGVVEGVITIPFASTDLLAEPRAAGEQSSRTSASDFFAGPENRLAVVATLSVLLDPCPYHPVVLCGPAGVGKSHLAAGVARLAMSRFPDRKIICKLASDFAREFADSVDTSSVEEYVGGLSAAWLLVLEDLDQLAGKQAAQQQLASLLDWAESNGGRVLLTLSQPPAYGTTLIAGLRSRLMGGLVAEIHLPSEACRRQMAAACAARRGVTLAPEQLTRLAAHAGGAYRQIDAAVRRLALRAAVPAHAQPLLDGDALASARPAVSLSRVATLVAREFGLRVGELAGVSRRRQTARARGVAMYLSRQWTAASLQRVAQHFGRSDHTTVMHACEQTKRRLNSDPELSRQVAAIERALAGA
jgi:chromosomal replication initiator protein